MTRCQRQAIFRAHSHGLPKKAREDFQANIIQWIASYFPLDEEDVAIKSRVRCGIATALRKMEGCLHCRILIECQLEEAIYWRHFVPTEEIEVQERLWQAMGASLTGTHFLMQLEQLKLALPMSNRCQVSPAQGRYSNWERKCNIVTRNVISKLLVSTSRHLKETRRQFPATRRHSYESSIPIILPDSHNIAWFAIILPDSQNIAWFPEYCLIPRILPDSQNIAWFPEYCLIPRILLDSQNIARFPMELEHKKQLPACRA